MGRSDHPDHFKHSVEAYAEFIGVAISALGIQRAHLVMNDIEGSALRWAADNPEAFASSVQINTGIINQTTRPAVPRMTGYDDGGAMQAVERRG